MTVGEMKKALANVPDNTPVEYANSYSIDDAECSSVLGLAYLQVSENSDVELLSKNKVILF